MGMCRREVEKQIFHATAVCLTACFLAEVASWILTAELMQEGGTLKCISESWDVISTATWILPPSCQAVLCVDYFRQKCSVFSAHHHLFIQVLIKKLID